MGLKLLLLNIRIFLITLLLFAWYADVLAQGLGAIAPGYWHDWLFLVTWMHIAIAGSKTLQYSWWVAELHLVHMVDVRLNLTYLLN